MSLTPAVPAAAAQTIYPWAQGIAAHTVVEATFIVSPSSTVRLPDDLRDSPGASLVQYEVSHIPRGDHVVQLQLPDANSSVYSVFLIPPESRAPGARYLAWPFNTNVDGSHADIMVLSRESSPHPLRIHYGFAPAQLAQHWVTQRRKPPNVVFQELTVPAANHIGCFTVQEVPAQVRQATSFYLLLCEPQESQGVIATTAGGKNRTAAIKESSRCAIAAMTQKHVQESIVTSRVRALRQTSKLSDCTLLSADGEGRFPCHKVILAMHSAVWEHALFDVDMAEKQTSEMRLEADAATVTMLLDYVYDAVLPAVTSENAVNMFSVAHMYELRELKEHFAKAIEMNAPTLVTVGNVLDFAVLSKLHSLERVKKRCLEVLRRNRKEVEQQPQWEEFCKTHYDLLRDFIFMNV